MTGKIPIWSWRHAIMKSGMSSGARHLCHVIACDLSDTGKFTRLSVAELSEAMGISPRSITTHIAEAEAAGLLKVERIRNPDGYVVGTRYYPRFPDHMELAKEPAEEASETLSAKSADRPNEARETLQAKIADRAGQGEKVVSLPAKNDTPTGKICGHNKETFPSTFPIKKNGRATACEAETPRSRAETDPQLRDRRAEIGSAMKDLVRSLRASNAGKGGR